MTGNIAQDLEFELQETDRARELDSLETVVVKSYLSARGYEVPNELVPHPNNLEAWLKWVAQASSVG